MRAGALNRRITIQTKTTTYGTYNEPIETWADDFTEWVGMETTGGGEFYAAQKMYAQTTVVFTMRYRTDITTLNRIKYGTRYFEILGPPNNVNESNRTILIAAKEVT